MARLAFDVPFASMLLVREDQLTRRIGKGHKILLIDMAERAVALHLIFVACCTVLLLAEKIIRGEFAFLCISVTILTRGAHILQMVFVRKLDKLRTVFFLPCLQRCLACRQRNQNSGEERKSQYEVSTKHNLYRWWLLEEVHLFGEPIVHPHEKTNIALYDSIIQVLELNVERKGRPGTDC